MNEKEFKRLLRKGIISFSIKPYIYIQSKRSGLIFEADGDINSSVMELFRKNKKKIIEMLNEDKEDFKEVFEELNKNMRAFTKREQIKNMNKDE